MTVLLFDPATPIAVAEQCLCTGSDGNKSEIAVSSLDLKGNLCLGGTSSSPLSFCSSPYPWLIFWPKQRTLWGPPTDALFFQSLMGWKLFWRSSGIFIFTKYFRKSCTYLDGMIMEAICREKTNVKNWACSFRKDFNPIFYALAAKNPLQLSCQSAKHINFLNLELVPLLSTSKV